MTTVLSSKLFSAQLLLVAGAATATVVNLNGSSRLLSIERVIVGGGVVGTPVAQIVPPSGVGAGAVWELNVASSSATDVGTYEVVWSNGYIPSQYLVQGGALAGAQFSP